MHADDDRSRRSRAGPDLRLRHNGRSLRNSGVAAGSRSTQAELRWRLPGLGSCRHDIPTTCLLIHRGSAQRRRLRRLTSDITARRAANCDIRHGFVYKRVPHVMLGSIARNDEDRSGHEPGHDRVNSAIARELSRNCLVDQPYEDPRKVRVSGRFTVESLSPHRTLDEPNADGE